MEYKKLNGEYYLRLDPGDEILESIAKVCEREKIFGGHFQGIGACGELTISTYSPLHDFAGHFEIVSLLGNITKTDKINLHAHANFSYADANNQLANIGGHLRRALINYTAEIIIRPANEIISQRFDIIEDVGVWKLP